MNSYDKHGPQFFPLQVRTAYADLLDRLRDLEAGNAMATLSSCSLVVKRVSGREYLYAQGRVADGAVRQIYLGPYDAAAQVLRERFQSAKAEGDGERADLATSARFLRSAGVPALDPVEWRVVDALAQDGVFRVGGVLVGTVGFRCLGGLLGVKLPAATALTADVDVAARTVAVAIIPEVVCPQSALERLELGFSPMMDADPALHGSRFKAREGEFKVEFLTPLTGRDQGHRFEIRQLGVTAIPLRFLDYLIESPVPAVALGRRPVLVRVPSPSRYAVHKLIVAGERRQEPLKAQKDLRQSFELQGVLAELDPDALVEAFDEARARGPGWAKRVDAGQAAMERLWGPVRG
ncbi:MAG: GSU2403 family nucleotidyltransferase fold protein [Deferrisomatales bacterium]